MKRPVSFKLRGATSAILAIGLLTNVAKAQSQVPLTGRMASPATTSVQSRGNPVATPMPGPSASAAAGPVARAAPTTAAASVPAAPSTQPGASSADVAIQRPASDQDDFGLLTRGLLAAQADGRAAGPLLPTLGDVSTAAYQRYMDSFKLAIPQWFQQQVQSQGSGSGSGSQ